MNGHAVLIASLELPTVAVTRKLLSAVAGVRWDRLERGDRAAAFDRLAALPIYLLDRYGECPVSRLREEIAYGVRRHGVTLVVVDHLHFALGVRKAGEDERMLIDAAAQAIQCLALELDIHVLMVMHPGKIKTGEDGRAREPDIGDLKGSSGPPQFADNVARIARLDGGRAVLTLLKTRSELGKLGHVVYGFDPEALRFTDVGSSLAERKKRPVRDGRSAAAGEAVEERAESRCEPDASPIALREEGRE